MESSDNQKLTCSFCGKNQEDVKKLIAGPSVYICDECVDLCNDIIEEEIKADDPDALNELPSPAEIFSQLDDYCLLYTSPSPRDRTRSRMPSSA